MLINEGLTIEEKLTILADAAKYDVACTSSGVQRENRPGQVGNSSSCGICHTFAADGRCISLLKILYTNECVHDCKYCVNRISNDTVRTSFTPEELCELTMGFYRRNYIEGLFLSSGIIHTPDETMQQIYTALRMLREQYKFNGYIHCKAIPGADPALVEMCGWYADRMSVNLEFPTSEGLKALAPGKSRKKILTPLRQIQDGIAESHAYLGMNGGNKGAYWYTQRRLEGDYSEFTGGIEQVAEDRARLAERLNRRLGKKADSKPVSQSKLRVGEQSDADVKNVDGTEEKSSRYVSDEYEIFGQDSSEQQGLRMQQPGQIRTERVLTGSGNLPINSRQSHLQFMNQMTGKRGFVPAGQSSQMIIGATQETDLQIISVSEALYQKFDLKRVFYSAFIRVNEDSALPVIPGGPPLLREHRLYQADWLLRYYGFAAKELLTEQRPNFNVYLDPKCNWAIDHLGMFPVEINDADYFTLLRVPGIGPKSARRIVSSRKTARLDYFDLKKMGVVLKRAQYFITCSGKMMEHMNVSEDMILSRMIGEAAGECRRIMDSGITYRQLSLFDTMNAGEAAAETGWNLIGCNLPKVGRAV